MTDVRVLPDPSQLAAAACAYVLSSAHAAIAARGRFTLVLTGGSTPKLLYQELARHTELPWDKVEILFGDERAVPLEHKDSNAGMARATLTGQPFIPPARVHRMRGELPAHEAAADYEATLRELFPEARGFPSFDLLLLGLGSDGHIASLFPHSRALGETRAWVTDNWVEKLGAERITLTYPVLNEAADTLFLVAGADKAWAVHEAIEGQAAIDDVPVRGIQPRSGKRTFMLDVAAAAQLTVR
jgi:6-phosphogluconolactonase